MTYLLCTKCAIPAVTPMVTPMARQRKSVPPYGYLAVLGLAAIARNSHAHEADTDAASSVTISNDANIPNPAENQILTGTVKANKLVGGDGDDEISGDAGYDRLLGEDDHDWLFGGAIMVFWVPAKVQISMLLILVVPPITGLTPSLILMLQPPQVILSTYLGKELVPRHPILQLQGWHWAQILMAMRF